MLPDEYGADWTRAEHLLAIVADLLAIANWQRAGGKRSKRPKPISPLAKPKVTRYGRTTMTPDEAKAYLAKLGPPPS